MILQTRVSRSIEKLLTDELVKQGYMPNRANFLGNMTAYESAQQTILQTKGFCVEVFGHGTPSDRANKFVPRIVINMLGFLPGSVGNDPSPTYALDDSEQKFNRVKSVAKTSNLRFEIELTSNKASQDGYIEYIRGLVLPNQVYVPFYDAKKENDIFLITYNFIRQNPDFGHGLIQKIYSYEVVDVMEVEDSIITGTPESKVSKIKTINVKDSENQNPIIKRP